MVEKAGSYLPPVPYRDRVWLPLSRCDGCVCSCGFRSVCFLWCACHRPGSTLPGSRRCDIARRPWAGTEPTNQPTNQPTVSAGQREADVFLSLRGSAAQLRVPDRIVPARHAHASPAACPHRSRPRETITTRRRPAAPYTDGNGFPPASIMAVRSTSSRMHLCSLKNFRRTQPCAPPTDPSPCVNSPAPPS